MKKMIIVFVIVGSIVASLPGLVLGQGAARRNPRIIQLEDVKVEGKVAGPEAVFIINLKDLQFEGLEPKKSFLSEIIKSVEKEPF